MNAESEAAPAASSQGAQAGRQAQQIGPRVLHSDEILKGDDEVQIVHFENVYRLRKTRNGKLILQK